VIPNDYQSLPPSFNAAKIPLDGPSPVKADVSAACRDILEACGLGNDDDGDDGESDYSDEEPHYADARLDPISIPYARYLICVSPAGSRRMHPPW
jgi:hypothetical protein